MCYNKDRIKGKEMNATVTNITELWMDEGKKDALILAGFSEGGSDYEVFRNLCTAFEKLPGHPERKISAYQLQTLFGISLPLTSDFCDEIWKQTAESLLDVPQTPLDAKLAKERLPRVDWEPFAPDAPGSFRILPPKSASDYREWSKLQKPAVGLRMRLDLPTGFHAESPNLYRVNRHLSGEEPDENLWLCQQARFLCETCAANGGELLFCSAETTEELPRLLRILASQVCLPRFYWIFGKK